MKWQWKLGRFAGIDVYIHTTFLLIVGWYGYLYWLEGRTFASVLEGVALILLLFLAVTLHEYGHALTARKFGIKTRNITLYPIGGVARLERMPDKPIQEFWVALAGPAVNLVIAAVLFGWLFFTGAFIPVSQLTLSTVPFIERLAVIKLVAGAFQPSPSLPDGRRTGAALAAGVAVGIRPGNENCSDRRSGNGHPVRHRGYFRKSFPAPDRLFRLVRSIPGSRFHGDETQPQRCPRYTGHDVRLLFAASPR